MTESRRTSIEPQEGVLSEAPSDPRRTDVEPAPVSQGGTDVAPATASTAPMRFRPIRRPPMAILTALDDGCSETGESWRIRKPQFIIGRVSGDAIISHDDDISAEHAEISYRWQDGSYRWRLRDLGSTNGTFLRVKKMVLTGNQEFLIGGRRYEFRVPRVLRSAPQKESMQNSLGPRATRKYQNVTPGDFLTAVPQIVEVGSDGDVRLWGLSDGESWLGSDPARCTIVVDGDPFVSQQHACFCRDHRGRWTIEDAGSVNAVWVRIRSVPLDGSHDFQIGEQRFHFQVV